MTAAQLMRMLGELPGATPLRVVVAGVELELCALEWLPGQYPLLGRAVLVADLGELDDRAPDALPSPR